MNQSQKGIIFALLKGSAQRRVALAGFLTSLSSSLEKRTRVVTATGVVTRLPSVELWSRLSVYFWVVTYPSVDLSGNSTAGYKIFR